jgi:hypothetical protein
MKGCRALAAAVAIGLLVSGAAAAAPEVDALSGLPPVESNQVTLSCNDGHSVALSVDSATLSSLVADVEAINSSGTGMSCVLDTTATASTQTADWTVYDYNPSGNAIAPRNSPNKHPATTSGTVTNFDFLPGGFTTLLTTSDPSLTGDLSTTTLMDQISVSGPATTFMTQHNGGDCVSNFPAAVRFYFVSPSASGSSVGSPPAGFYTRFWWSNPVNLPLTAGNQNGSITANVGDPNEWSDWNGQRGDSSPEVLTAFEQAIHKVQTVGLSFGGECFFETGVNAVYPTGTPHHPTRSSPATSARRPRPTLEHVKRAASGPPSLVA